MRSVPNRLSSLRTMTLATILGPLLGAWGCGGVAVGGLFPPPVVPPDPPQWPDAGAVVLEDIATLDLDVLVVGDPPREKLVAVLDHRLRVKITGERGLEQAKVRLPIDAYSTVSQVFARSVSPSGRVKSMSPDDIRVVRHRDEKLRVPEIKELTFTIPGAQVGGMVEYRYKRVYSATALIPPWVFGNDVPTVRGEFSVIAPKDLGIDFAAGIGSQLSADEPLKRKAGPNRSRLIWVMRDLPPLYSEPRMPHRARVAPWVTVVVTQARYGGSVQRLQTWEDVASRVQRLFDQVGGSSGSGSIEQRYAEVRDKLVGLDVMNLGGVPPRDASALWSGEPATTRDAAALLFNRLKSSSAKVYPALLTAPVGPPVVQGLPGLYPFVRVVVAVDVKERVKRDPSCREDPISRGLLCSIPEDSYAFLDPLCRSCRFGELPSEFTGGRALVLLDGEVQWASVPEDPPERNRVMSQYRASLDVDGTLKGSVSTEATGAVARRIRDGLWSAESTEARDEVVSATLVGLEGSLKLQRARVTGRDKIERPLRVRAKLKSTAEKNGYEDFMVRPVDVVGPALPGDWRTSRRYPALLDAPLWVETVASVDIPAGYAVEDRPVVKLVEPFAEYAAGFAKQDRTLAYSRRLVVKQHIISAEQWRDFSDFLDRIRAIEESGVRVWFVQEGQ